MPFDGTRTISPAVRSFLIDHNLSAHPSLIRMSLAEARIWYNSCAYRPQVNGVAYAVELEEPDMFAGHDVPQDLVHHQVDEMDDLRYDDASGRFYVKAPRVEHTKTKKVAS